MTEKLLLHKACGPNLADGHRVQLHHWDIPLPDPRDGKIRWAEVTIEMVVRLKPEEIELYESGPTGQADASRPASPV